MEFCICFHIYKEAASWKWDFFSLALLLKRLRPRVATLSQRYFTDKRCESFFFCSRAADSSLCTGDQLSAWSSRGVHHPDGSLHSSDRSFPNPIDEKD